MSKIQCILHSLLRERKIILRFNLRNIFRLQNYFSTSTLIRESVMDSLNVFKKAGDYREQDVVYIYIGQTKKLCNRLKRSCCS